MLNLIVHMVLESTSSSAQERKAYDFNQVHTIIQKHLGLNATIDNPIRLGKRDPAKTHLLKITVASLKFKRKFYATMLSYKMCLILRGLIPFSLHLILPSTARKRQSTKS